MRTTTNKALRVELLPKLFGAYILPQFVPGAGHRGIEINVRYVGLQSCFGPNHFYSPMSFFQDGTVYPAPCCVPFFKTRIIAKNLTSQRRLYIWTF